MTNYVDEAIVTASDKFCKESLSATQLRSIIQGILHGNDPLDNAKKALFYGAPIRFVTPVTSPHVEGVYGSINPDLIHGVLGMVTESIELLEALDKALRGDGLDTVNISEELGDIFWYMALMSRALGVSFEQIQEANINKLKARYPEKFSQEKALSRDLETERGVLEESLDLEE
jgi:NTP pyrophosphatase (non-canonical NTP hydrolase)